MEFGVPQNKRVNPNQISTTIMQIDPEARADSSLHTKYLTDPSLSLSLLQSLTLLFLHHQQTHEARDSPVFISQTIFIDPRKWDRSQNKNGRSAARLWKTRTTFLSGRFALAGTRFGEG